MGDTAISWTHRPGTRGRTWNPVRGCSRVSEGCRHCYAEVQAARIVRMGKGKPTVYDELVRLVGGEPRWTGKVVLDPEKLAAPLSWRKPSTVFVNSMSDLFHEMLTNDQIAAVFGVMAACPQHTFQILTKRAKRMREWFEWINDGHFPKPGVPFRSQLHRRDRILRAAMGLLDGIRETFPKRTDEWWPLPNVWLGVSVENQDAADERIPELLETPAAVRFLSCEPMLGAVDLTQYLDPCAVPCGEEPWPLLDWIISGCESGPGARPCEVAWLRSLRDQCAAASVPYFLKQANERTGSVTMVGHRVPLDDAYTGYSPRLGSLIPTIVAAAGSKQKPGGVIELPYLDGVQHAAWPKVG